jgi:hypothetical protein
MAEGEPRESDPTREGRGPAKQAEPPEDLESQARQKSPQQVPTSRHPRNK